MTHSSQTPLRVLAPTSWTRRNLLRLAGAAGSAAALTIDGVHPALAALDFAGDAKLAAAPAGAVGDSLFIYSWAGYANPDVLKGFSSGTGARIQIATFDTDEAMIAKLQISGKSAGYDIAVVGDSYVPQMLKANMLLPLDHAKIPNIVNLTSRFKAVPWDPGNHYTVIKALGTQGILYNKSAIPHPIVSWDDFFKAAALPGVSGRVSIMPDQPSVFGLVFWREGHDFNTGDPKKLNDAKNILLKELIPHVAAFDADPVQGLLNGDYVLSHAYSGSGRHIFEQDPDRYAWVFPTPQCLIWSDQYAIPVGARNVDGAHAFINYVLNPEVSAAELSFIGYDTGVQGVLKSIPSTLIRKDMIVFPEDVLKRLVFQKVEGSSPQLRIQMLNELKAAASK